MRKMKVINKRNEIRLMILLLICLLAFLSCDVNRHTRLTYQEQDDKRSFDTLAWQSVQRGIHISVASIDERYNKKIVPCLNKTNQWSGQAWRGERINLQLLFWTTKELVGTNCIVSDLVDKNGHIISKENIKSYFVRYVLTDEFGGGCTKRNAIKLDSSIVADALDPIKYFDIKAQETRPIWITIDVPENCKAGNYSGWIRIVSDKQKSEQIEINLSVNKRQLPNPKNWDFHLDLWQNPFAVARYSGVKVWSDEHFELLKPLMKMLANAGQKCITASIIEKPWGGQTYDHFESLIAWKKLVDGKWSFDYRAFDRWVEFAMDCGITRQINCYSMIPWGNKFTYYDEIEQKDTTIEALPGSISFENLWSPFLKQFIIHLKEKGWDNITTIAMDERAPEDMQKTINLVKAIAPELKLTYAGGFHKEISDSIFDLCIASGNAVPTKEMEMRRQAEKITTFYVCCAERSPNSFTFSPPYESVYMGWYAAAKGYDGFLRWAYNSWVENPLIDSRFYNWPAGDTYLVYPNGISSIRFERLREGIQDYEKIRILRDEFMSKASNEARKKLQELDNFLATINIDKSSCEMKESINRGKRLLNRMIE